MPIFLILHLSLFLMQISLSNLPTNMCCGYCCDRQLSWHFLWQVFQWAVYILQSKPYPDSLSVCYLTFIFQIKIGSTLFPNNASYCSCTYLPTFCLLWNNSRCHYLRETKFWLSWYCHFYINTSTKQLNFI